MANTSVKRKRTADKTLPENQLGDESGNVIKKKNLRKRKPGERKHSDINKIKKTLHLGNEYYRFIPDESREKFINLLENADPKDFPDQFIGSIEKALEFAARGGDNKANKAYHIFSSSSTKDLFDAYIAIKCVKKHEEKLQFEKDIQKLHENNGFCKNMDTEKFYEKLNAKEPKSTKKEKNEEDEVTRLKLTKSMKTYLHNGLNNRVYDFIENTAHRNTFKYKSRKGEDGKYHIVKESIGSILN